PPRSTLFPYTTLFRSLEEKNCCIANSSSWTSIALPKTREKVTEWGVESRVRASAWTRNDLRKASQSAMPSGSSSPASFADWLARSEEHTSELQSRGHL